MQSEEKPLTYILANPDFSPIEVFEAFSLSQAVAKALILKREIGLKEVRLLLQISHSIEGLL
jgi:hypothetical protein